MKVDESQNLMERNTSRRAGFAVVAIALTGLVACSQGQVSGQAPGGYDQIQASDSDTGIIGGKNATGTEDFSKSIASVLNVVEGGLCTASIYSDSILITAAHCVSGPASSLRVLFGTDLQNANRVIRSVVAYQVSPLYPLRSTERFNTGDVAVVRFSGGLPPGYVPAKILSDVSALKNGTSVLLAGYGINDGAAKTGAGVLRYVDVEIQDASYSETEVLLDQTKGKGACHGDSGGPAYVRVNGQWMLWGITNRGINDPRDLCSVSAAYASIPFYMNWIRRTAAKLALKPVIGVQRVAGF